MRLFLYACAIAVLCCSCRRSSDEQTRYLDDGRMKPSVVLVPLIDSSGKSWAWDLSEELTTSLREKLLRHGQLYISNDAKAKHLFQSLGKQHNPFGNQIEWIRQCCPEENFAVFLELIEHEEVPLLTQRGDDPSLCPSQFNVSVRIRVIDLRNAPCKVVLQEILHDHHHIPKQFTKFHFHQEPWDRQGGQQSFLISPVGLAHAQLVREITSRIEDHILTSPVR